MKWNSLIGFLLMCACYASTSAQSADSHTYLTEIGNQFTAVSQDMMSYTSAASHGRSARNVEKKRQELLATVKLAEQTVRKSKPYHGDTHLRDTVASYFRLSRLVLLEDYGKIVNMEEIAEQSYDAMEAYLLAKEKASDKLEAIHDRVSDQYRDFAAKYNIQLVDSESKLSQKLETTGKVYSYYNQVYLIYFKSYKDELYLNDALSKKDLNAMEQTKNTLEKSAGEGVEKLKKIGSYQNDATLRTAAQQMLSFYQQESIKMNEQIDFFLKKERFEKLRVAFEAKRPNERTQDDASQYNKAASDINKSINQVNSAITDLNKRRTELINNWNKTSDAFLANHVPKYR